MHFQSLLPILAVFGTALAAVPNERGPVTGNAIAARGGNVDSYCDPTRRANSDQQKDIFKKFKNKMYGDKKVIDAFNKHVAKDLIEHGPYDPQGRDDVAAKLAPIFANGKYDILRWNYDNDYGTVMLKVYLPTGEELALIDLYRMEGTCIVEHWDISQVKPADATNPIAMF